MEVSVEEAAQEYFDMRDDFRHTNCRSMTEIITKLHLQEVVDWLRDQPDVGVLLVNILVKDARNASRPLLQLGAKARAAPKTKKMPSRPQAVPPPKQVPARPQRSKSPRRSAFSHSTPPHRSRGTAFSVPRVPLRPRHL